MSTRRSLQRAREQQTQTDENVKHEDDMHHQHPAFIHLGVPSPPVSDAIKKLSKVCGRCSEMKMRCSGGFPCERCWRLSLPCMPRMRYKPRKKKDSAEAEEGAVEEGSSSHDGDTTTALTISSASSTTTSSSSTFSIKRPKTTATPVLTASEQYQYNRALLFTELLIHRQDPRKNASIYLRIFHEMHARGEIRRSRVIFCMRMWRVQSLVVDADTTWGIGKVIAETMNISAAEVEGPELLALGPSPNQKRRIAQIAAWKATEMAFRATERFRKVDNGERVKMVLLSDNSFRYATSSSYDDLFQGASRDAVEEVTKRKMIPALVNVSFVCPDDVEEALRLHMMVVHGTLPAYTSGFGKMVNRDGEIRLYYYNIRSSRDPETGDECTVLRYEPAPPSKYLRDTPLTQCRSRMQTFTQEGFQARVKGLDGSASAAGGGEDGSKATTAAAAEGGAADVMITPLVCLPVSAASMQTRAALPPSLGASSASSLDAPVVEGDTAAAATTANPPLSMEEHLKRAMGIFKLQAPNFPTRVPPPLTLAKGTVICAGGVAGAGAGAGAYAGAYAGAGAAAAAAAAGGGGGEGGAGAGAGATSILPSATSHVNQHVSSPGEMMLPVRPSPRESLPFTDGGDNGKGKKGEDMDSRSKDSATTTDDDDEVENVLVQQETEENQAWVPILDNGTLQDLFEQDLFEEN